MKLNLKERKGITLIALVITIVILLILAGVTLNIALGDNGIFKKSKQAAELYKIKQAEEENEIDKAYNVMLGVTSSRGDISDGDIQTIISEINDLKTQMQDMKNGVNPTGTIIAQMGNSAPTGYLTCNGDEYEISSYPALADYFKKQFGSEQYFGGTGTKFKVPNLQGEFLRGTGTNSHTDQGNGANIGTHQDATNIPNIYMNYPIRMIAGYAKDGSNGHGTNNRDSTVYGTGEGFNTPGGTTFKDNSSIVSYTTRPTNTSVLYCIKW